MPGERWQYSNTGYVLAGAVLEKVTGETLFGFLQSRVFHPLHMESVADIDQGQLGVTDAVGYTVNGLGPLRPGPKEAPGWLFAAGELAMTAEDLARWDISLMQQSLLSNGAYNELETDTILRNGAGTRYGLGIGVRTKAEHRILAHSGEVSGFISDNEIYPDDQAAIVVLTNTDASNAASTIAQKIEALIFVTSAPADASRTARDKETLLALAHGKIDRSRLSSNCNAYYSDAAVSETAKALKSMGPLKSFELTNKATRGGMDARVYKAVLQKKTLTAISRAWPDGRIEQFTLDPE